MMSWENLAVWSKAVIMMVVFAVGAQDLSLSVFATFERKNVIHAETQVASALEEYYKGQSRQGLRLFFPFASGYRIMEFGAYLNYRGIPLDQLSLGTPTLSKDAFCFEYQMVKCVAMNRAIRGDLIIILPDDPVSLSQVSPYRRDGQLLLKYQPVPAMPRWLYKLVDGLPLAAVDQTARPDRWLDASVTLWTDPSS